MTADWDCEAYGPPGRLFGALCFRTAAGRACAGPDECHQVMDAERRRVFDRITELAQGGDEVAVHLAEQFSSPDELLGGAE